MSDQHSNGRRRRAAGSPPAGGRTLLGLVLALTAGCGGGRHGLATDPAGTGTSAAGAGRVSITIQWPDASSGAVSTQAIPVKTQSVVIRLENPSNAKVALAPPAILNRDQNSTSVTQSFPSVRVGPVLVRVRAFDAPNAGGNRLAQATGVTTVAKDQTATVSILLAQIDRIDLTPPAVVVGKGTTAQLTATARDAAGNVLFVRSDGLQWSSSDPSVATVDQNGEVTGVGAGAATITVRDVDPPNRTATAQVGLDGVAPQVTNTAPADNALIARTNPPILAKIVDAAPSTGINTANALLQLDGAPRVLSTSDLTVQADGSATLRHQAPNLAEGRHTVHFEIEDNAGNRGATDWAFTIDTVPPQVSRVRGFNGQTEDVFSTEPSNPTFLFDLPTEIRADVADATSSINPAPAAFTIEVRRILDPNGKPVTDAPRVYSFLSLKLDPTDPKKGIVIFQRSRTDTAPAQFGTYTVTITATDLAGNVTPKAPVQFVVALG